MANRFLLPIISKFNCTTTDMSRRPNCYQTGTSQASPVWKSVQRTQNSSHFAARSRLRSYLRSIPPLSPRSVQRNNPSPSLAQIAPTSPVGFGKFRLLTPWRGRRLNKLWQTVNYPDFVWSKPFPQETQRSWNAFSMGGHQLRNSDWMNTLMARSL